MCQNIQAHVYTRACRLQSSWDASLASALHKKRARANMWPQHTRTHTHAHPTARQHTQQHNSTIGSYCLDTGLCIAGLLGRQLGLGIAQGAVDVFSVAVLLPFAIDDSVLRPTTAVVRAIRPLSREPQTCAFVAFLFETRSLKLRTIRIGHGANRVGLTAQNGSLPCT